MSKKIYLFSLVLLALAFVSCSETEEEGKFANWRACMMQKLILNWNSLYLLRIRE